ncbi:MAG: RNA-binding protein [Actinomycetota bacterium]
MTGPAADGPDDPPGRWLVDGNNVMGSRPDGWWRDRTAAKVRLTGDLSRLAVVVGQPTILVFDGHPIRAATAAADGIEVRFAGSGRADAADDEIVAIARAGDTVVTADRGLIERLPDGVDVVGPITLLTALLGSSDGGCSTGRQRLESAEGGE